MAWLRLLAGERSGNLRVADDTCLVRAVKRPVRARKHVSSGLIPGCGPVCKAARGGGLDYSAVARKIRSRSSAHEGPVHVGHELEMHVVLVGAVVVRGEHHLEQIALHGAAHHAPEQTSSLA